MARKLEQFEKWCDEIEYLCVDYTKRDALRRGWKAALKWIESINTGEAYNTVDQAIYEELGNDN